MAEEVSLSSLGRGKISAKRGSSIFRAVFFPRSVTHHHKFRQIETENVTLRNNILASKNKSGFYL